MAASSIYDFEANTLDGQAQKLSAFKGQVLLVVNTASKCGLTPQYEGLEALYKKHQEQGLVVLGFPCNQFGNQESGSAAQIQHFCQKNYGVSFPMFEKIEVNGKNAHPLYKFLTAKLGGGLLGSKIKWNFTKFLIDRDGNPVKRYAPTTSPEKIEKDITKLLK